MTGDEERGFLAKICAEPDDDTHRLVYADWLDENGRPERAEFIRVQVAIAHLESEEPEGKDSMYMAGWRLAMHRNKLAFSVLTGEPCRCVLCLCGREKELLDAPGDASGRKNAYVWAGLPAAQFDATRYRRGFVEEIACSSADWVRDADRIRSLHPVRRVDLTTDPGGHWEGDIAGDGAVFVLPGCPRTVTELEVLASRRRLGTWVDDDPDTHTPHSLPDVLAAIWPGVSFEVPVAGNDGDFAEFQQAMLGEIATALAIPPGVASTCYEITLPGDATRFARVFRVTGPTQPQAAALVPGVANGAAHPTDPRRRARTFTSEGEPGGSWRVTIEYELEPGRLFARVNDTAEVEIPSLGWLISAGPEEEPEFHFRSLRTLSRWQPPEPRRFDLVCESGPPFHDPPAGVLGATFGPVIARGPTGHLFTVARARVSNVERVETSSHTWGRVRYHAVAESEPAMLTPE